MTVTCTTNTYTIGGTISGLVGTGLVLQDNGGDNLAITSNGNFTFATPVASGGAYAVNASDGNLWGVIDAFLVESGVDGYLEIDLHAGMDVPHTGPIEDRYVLRALLFEQRTGVDRGRVQRIVVAGQQVHRHVDGAHGVQRLADHPGRQLVGVEDVTGHDHELRAGLPGERADGDDRVAAGGGIAGLSVLLQEVASHTQLPVSGVQELHRRECMAGVRQVVGTGSACALTWDG